MLKYWKRTELKLQNIVYDRIVVNSALIVGVFLSVLLLSSQSGASFVTYLLCFVMLVRVRDWNDVRYCPLFWPIIALLVYLPITSVWSEGFTWRDFGSQAVRAILTLTFVVAFAECQLRGLLQAWLYDALVFTGAAVAVLCLVLFFVNPPADGRMVGLGQLDAAVIAGLIFGFVLLVAVHQIYLSKGSRRALILLTMLPLLAAIVASGSRGAMFASVAGVMALSGAHLGLKNRGYILLLIALGSVALAALSYAWFDPELHQLLFPRGDSFRIAIWHESLVKLQDAPWFGLGVLTEDDVFNGQFWFDHPHNLYLSVAVQGGVVGLLLFGWLLVRVIRELLINSHTTDARLGLGIMALALPAYFLDGHELLDKVSDTWFLIWLPTAIALGLRWHRSY